MVLLGLGALFLSFSTEYAPEIYALLFGEVLGVSTSEVLPVAILAAGCVAAIAVLYRPLLLSSVMPELAEARGVPGRPGRTLFLVRRGAGHQHDPAGRRGAAHLQPDDRAARGGPAR